MKKWLIDRYLPMWAKESVLRENRDLWAENGSLRERIRELEAYVQGMQAGMRAGKRINIYNRGGE